MPDSLLELDATENASIALISFAIFAPRDESAQLITLIKPYYFQLISHQMIWQAITNLWERGETVDLVTTASEIEALGYLEKLGGGSALTKLINDASAIDATMIYNHALTYAAIVREQWRKRAFLDLASKLATAVINRDALAAQIAHSQMSDLFLENAQNQNPFVPLNPSELANLPGITWMIPQVLPTGGLIIVYGAPGVGKTFAALDMAAALAQTRPVVYIAGEGIESLSSRIRVWEYHFKRSVGAFYTIPRAVPLNDAQAVNDLIQVLTPIAPSIIIYDTLSRCFPGGDENSQSDTSRLIDALERIRRATGAANLLIHHSTKGGGDLRGSSVLRGAADVVIRIEEDDQAIAVICEKNKHAATFLPRRFGLVTRKSPEGDEACVILPAAQVDFKDGALDDKDRLILKTLTQENTPEGGLSVGEVALYTDTASKTIYRRLGNLVWNLMIEMKDKKYLATEKGKKALLALSQEEALPKTGLNWHIDAEFSKNSHFFSHDISHNDAKIQKNSHSFSHVSPISDSLLGGEGESPKRLPPTEGSDRQGMQTGSGQTAVRKTPFSVRNGENFASLNPPSSAVGEAPDEMRKIEKKSTEICQESGHFSRFSHFQNAIDSSQPILNAQGVAGHRYKDSDLAWLIALCQKTGLNNFDLRIMALADQLDGLECEQPFTSTELKILEGACEGGQKGKLLQILGPIYREIQKGQ